MSVLPLSEQPVVGQVNGSMNVRIHRGCDEIGSSCFAAMYAVAFPRNAKFFSCSASCLRSLTSALRGLDPAALSTHPIAQRDLVERQVPRVRGDTATRIDHPASSLNLVRGRELPTTV